MPAASFLIKPASSLCNMRCNYCFYADVSSARSVASYGIMSEETLEETVKKALSYADGTCTIAFQGGEPTLAGLDFFRKYIDMVKKYNKKNVRVSHAIQTNGYVIDDEWAAFFAENQFLVGLSMDGPKDIHDRFRIDAEGKGTHSRVQKAARCLEKHGVKYNILCVVNNHVARHGAQVYQFFKKNGYKYLQFIPCLDAFGEDETHEYSLSPERYAQFLKTTFDLYYRDFMAGEFISVRTFDNYITMLAGYPPECCSMAGVCTCYFVVEGDGGLYPCDFYVLDEYRLGSINDSDLEELVKSEAAKRFVDVSRNMDAACRECKWFSLCRGGCRRDREPVTDGLPSLNRFCGAYQEFFEYSFPRLQKITAICQTRR